MISKLGFIGVVIFAFCGTLAYIIKIYIYFVPDSSYKKSAVLFEHGAIFGTFITAYSLIFEYLKELYNKTKIKTRNITNGETNRMMQGFSQDNNRVLERYRNMDN